MFTQSLSCANLGVVVDRRQAERAEGSTVAEVVTTGGVRIPKIGCGTYPMRGPQCAEIVAEALRAGFRHVDTAQGYDNEAAVGEGIQHSGVPRDEDLHHHKGAPAAHRRWSAAAFGRRELEAAEESKRSTCSSSTGPTPKFRSPRCMRALSAAKRAGMARAIGVSNFVIAKLEEAIEVVA